MEDEETEVAVDGHHDPLFVNRPAQQGLVAWVGRDLCRLAYIVALRSQPLREPVPCAPIDQESHPDTAIRSIRS
jgi:hypothetical protein